MRKLAAVAVLSLGACSSQNVAPLSAFGPMSAFIDVDLGPLGPEFARDVDARIYVGFDHSQPDCPVFDNDIDASIDGVRPDVFELGYYDEGGGYGHDSGPSCQSPYFWIQNLPAAKPTSVLRLRDATADYSLEVDRLFVNPAMSLATPLTRGQVARVDVTDDRVITMADAQWWVGDENSATGYPMMTTVASNVISFRMPSEVSGPGHLEIRVELAAPQLTCNGFAQCTVMMKGSQSFADTLL